MKTPPCAPNARTIPRLRAYEAAGKPFRLVVFPDADHTRLRFDEVDGERIYTGYEPTYFPTGVEGVVATIEEAVGPLDKPPSHRR